MPALGVFKHEAAAVDPERQVVYLTEDLPDGGFYRFRADHGLPDLTSGKLEVASVLEEGGRKIIRWIPVPDSQAREKPTRKQVQGYTSFRGGEGVAIYDDVVYFTTKHDNRVWAYDSVSGELSVIYDAESAKNPELTGVDNIVISPAGDVLVAEDSGNMQIIALTRKGSVIPIVQIVGHDRSEIAGPAFDPSFQRLYFSSQRGSIGDNKGGMTFEISLID
jgi:secreted PhoX family phosphatase